MLTLCSKLLYLCVFGGIFIPSLLCFSVQDVFVDHSLYKDEVNVLELKTVNGTASDYQLLL